MSKKKRSSGLWIFFAFISWILIANYGSEMFMVLLFCWAIYLIYSFAVRPTTQQHPKKVYTKATNNAIGVTLSFEVDDAHQTVEESNVFYTNETNVKIGEKTFPLYLCYLAKRSSLPHVITTSSKLGKAKQSLQTDMGYWPSYSSIAPNDRATYLLWHETGRKDPAADIGLVFIYFYGLEYRAIKEELNHYEIYKELIRLSEIYSEKSASFSGYCTAFISWLILKNPTWNYIDDLPRTNIPNSTSSLAKEVLWRAEQDCSGAIAMALSTDNLQIPKSLNNYSSEIIKEFKMELKGIEIREEDFKREAKHDYYRTATSLRLNPTVEINAYRPNAKTKKKLEILWEAILDKHAVFNKVQKMDPAIAALVAPDNKNLQKQISRFIDFDSIKQCNLSDLLQLIGSSERPNLTLAESKAISIVLHDNGILMEPDATITNKGFKYSEEVVLFKGSNNSFRADQWKQAVVLLDISAAIAFSDENSEDAEIKHTIEFITKQFNLNQTESLRLEMRVLNLKKGKGAPIATARKLGSTLNPKETGVLAKFLFSIASHDGAISSLELKALEKTFKAMNIPVTTLDILVKEFTENANGTLVKLKPASKKSAKSGSAVPKKTAPLPADTIILNQAALNTALADAAEVSRILSEVFSDDSESDGDHKSEPALQNDPSHPSEVTHLSSKEHLILKILTQKERWEISDVENLCRAEGVMYGSFINRVNDYYEIKTGSTILEEDSDELIVSLETLSNEVQIA